MAELEDSDSVFVYDAFLSYSSRSDYQGARRIETFLESFHRSVARVANVRPLQICRDGSDFRLPRKRAEDESTVDAVLQIVGKELSKSKALLVLCSPSARGSYYVNQEISLWLEKFSDRPILPVILQAKAPAEHPEECFPQALIQKQLHRAAIWYDLRAMRAPSADQVTSSGFRDVDDELVRLAGDLLEWDASKRGALATIWEREQLRQKRRTARVVTGIASLLIVLAVFAIYSALRAIQQQKAARANAIAMAADSAVDPLIGSLLLAELEDLPRPADAMRVARKIAQLPVPYASFQTSHPIIKAILSLDENLVLAASNDGRATLFRVDGTGDPIVFDSRWDDRPPNACNVPEATYVGPQSLTDVAFSPDGLHFATSSLDGSVRVWSLDSPRPVLSRFFNAPVEGVSFLPDNRGILASTSTGWFYQLSTDGTRCQSATLPGKRRVIKVRFPSEKRTGLVLAFDNSVWSLSPENGLTFQRLRTPRVDDVSAQTAAISDNNESILLADVSTVVWFSLNSLKSFRTNFSAARPNTASFSPDGKLLAIATSDGNIHILDSSTGIEKTPPLHASVQFLVSELSDTENKTEDTVWEVSSILFNADSSKLVVTSTSGTTRIWDLRTRIITHELRVSGAESTQFDRNEDSLVTYGIDGTVKVWHLREKTEPQLFQHTSSVEYANFLYDGQLVVTLTHDRKVHLWSRSSGREIPLDLNPQSKVKMVRVSRDAIFAVYETEIDSWHIGTSETVSHGQGFSDESLPAIVGAQVSSDGERLVAWSANGNAVSWSVSGRGNPDKCSLDSQLRSLRLNSDLTRALTSSRGGKIRAWDLRDFSHPRLILERDEQQLKDFDLSNSGASAVLTIEPADANGRQAKGVCRFLTLESNRRSVDLEFDRQDDWLDGCFLVPGERTVLLTSGQGRALLFDTKRPAQPRELRDTGGFAHQGMMVTPTFDRTGRQVFTFGAVDAEIKIWSLPGGTVDTLVGHGAAINSGLLSGDDEFILSASEDKSARLWRTQWLPMLHYLRARTTANLTVQQRIRYLGETEEVARRTRDHQELEFGRGRNAQAKSSFVIVPFGPKWGAD